MAKKIEAKKVAPSSRQNPVPKNLVITDDESPSTERGRRTKAALVRSAREVFEKHGFFDARITDISDGAGMAHGSFYTYFESKEAIFREVLNALEGEIFRASQVKGVVSDDPVERIDAANRLYLQAYARNARMMAILEQVGTFDDYFRQLTRDMREVFVDRNTRGIERLQREGLADPHLDARATAHVLGGMTEHFAYLWLGLGQSFDEEVAMATLTRVWAQAIGLTLPDWDASARAEAASGIVRPRL